jgi:hypothetical protein
MRQWVFSLALCCSTLVAWAAKSEPYVEYQQQQNTRILNFSQPPSGVLRVIHNISCIVQLTTTTGVQLPALLIGGTGSSESQVIYVPMQAASSLVSINTTPILAFVRSTDTVQFEAGYPGNVPVNLACTLTGNDNTSK